MRANMDTINTERLAEIKARAEAAHEGPWGIPPARSNATKFWLQPYKQHGDWSHPSWRGFITCDFKEDAEFVAHAREDIPTLIAAIESMQAENERLRHMLGPS